jgi:hypothetical protein
VINWRKGIRDGGSRLSESLSIVIDVVLMLAILERCVMQNRRNDMMRS